MVTRGSQGGVCVQSALTGRRKPDWDNTVHDLKMLKLTPAELDARSKAFKSKDWSRPGSLSSAGRRQAPCKPKVVKTTAPEENDSARQIESDDDFDEDIRRLESLQMHQPQLACNQQFVRGSPSLLHYLETEMQREMALSKKKQAPKVPKIRRRIKLELGHRNTSSANQTRLLNSILSNQNSANQSLVQELQKHVSYQEGVIKELNEFRVSATKELGNLVELVQKLISIQECKTSVAKRPESEDHQEKPASGALQGEETTKQDPTTMLENNNVNPPKPREVPGFLKNRATMTQFPQLQTNAEDPPAAKPENAPQHLERPAENKKRLPSTLLAKATQVSSDLFDRRENPLFESDLLGKTTTICGGPCKKSRLQEQASSPKWKSIRAAKALGEAEKIEPSRLGQDSQGAPQKLVNPEIRTGSTICLPVKKPGSEQDRFASTRPSKNTMQAVEAPSKLTELPSRFRSSIHPEKRCNQVQQEAPSKLPESRLEKSVGGPRYRLQGWSAAFLQAERRLRGKENNGLKATGNK